MRAARLSSVALLGVGALVVPSCRAPTNVIVTVTTDMNCSDFKGATVTVGQLSTLETTPESTESTSCDGSKRIGSVVLEPSASEDGAIAFRVVGGLGVDVESCKPPSYGPGCIVARRALKYFPHDSLRVNVRLESSCAGIPCGTTETCAGGACYPATIDDPNQCEGAGCDDSVVTGGSGALSTLTTDSVRHMTMDDTYIYWADRVNGQLVRQNRSLATKPEILNAPYNGALGMPEGLFLYGGEIWWGQLDGNLFHCPVAGCSGPPNQFTVVDDQIIDDVAVAGGTVYFTTVVDENAATDAKGDVYACPLSGCPGGDAQELVPGSNGGDPFRLFVDSNDVYWTWTTALQSGGPTGRVRKCPLGVVPCTPTDLASSEIAPWGIFVDSTNVYWTSYEANQIEVCGVAGCNGTPTVLATNQNAATSVTLDGTTAYWTERIADTGAVMKCDVQACNPTVVADKQDAPWDVLVDASYVYWANAGVDNPGIFRVHK